ncbi:BON domain-containing protein [Sorangium cellulosum]|uniref:BON domain-containing protein n=1 Tax=Sorangium cellulosum TaxID=56 RepID=UPI002279956E|nr:BON domain-containing protein [Sorangium cellulosum]
MREDICDQISDHPDLDASEVEVKVQNGEVILSGTVRERRFKHQLEVLAERISGVTDVRNEIRLQREQQQQQHGETKTSAGQSSSERSTSAGSTTSTSGSSAGAAGSASSLGATSSETKNNETRRNAS